MPTDPAAPAGRRTPPKLPRPTPAPRAASGAVARLRRALEAAYGDERSDVLEHFWTTTAHRTPLIEPVARPPAATASGPAPQPAEAVATFLWRDASARQVLLFVNRLTDERRLEDSLMERLPGTDLWHLSYRMPTTWRASYAVLPHRGGGPPPWFTGDQAALRQALDLVGRTDPGNPAVCRNRAGTTQSVAELPDAPPQSWLAKRPGTAGGRLTERTGPAGRRLWCYEPPGIQPDTETDLLIALDGEVWTSTQDLPTTLDNLAADRLIRPLRAVLLDSGGREHRWRELAAPGPDGGQGTDGFLAGELLDWARAEYPIHDGPTAVTVAGQSLGGLTALRTLTRHPGRIGGAISQSASLWQHDPTIDGTSMGPDAATLTGTCAWVEVGTEEWILQPPHGPMADRLRALGTDVRYREFTGGHDYACWRGSIAEAIRHLHSRHDRHMPTGPATATAPS